MSILVPGSSVLSRRGAGETHPFVCQPALVLRCASASRVGVAVRSSCVCVCVWMGGWVGVFFVSALFVWSMAWVSTLLFSPVNLRILRSTTFHAFASSHMSFYVSWCFAFLNFSGPSRQRHLTRSTACSSHRTRCTEPWRATPPSAPESSTTGRYAVLILIPFCSCQSLTSIEIAMSPMPSICCCPFQPVGAFRCTLESLSPPLPLPHTLLHDHEPPPPPRDLG